MKAEDWIFNFILRLRAATNTHFILHTSAFIIDDILKEYTPNPTGAVVRCKLMT